MSTPTPNGGRRWFELRWQRERAGVYRCANFLIVKLDATKHGARWQLSNDLVPEWEVIRPTLHQVKSIAHSCAVEAGLFSFGVAGADVDAGGRWSQETIDQVRAAAAAAPVTQTDVMGRLFAAEQQGDGNG